MNAQANPTSLQKALYSFVATKASLPEQGQFKPFEFPGIVNDQHWVVTSAIKSSKASLSLSLPEWSHKAFISVSDAHQDSFAELVASFNAESETNDALKVGYIEKLESPELNKFGWYGIAMIKPEFYFEQFPSTAVIDGEEYEFILVVLITAKELKLGRKQGFEALLAALETRDLVAFDQHVRLKTNSTKKTVGRDRAFNNLSAGALSSEMQNTATQPQSSVSNNVAAGPAQLSPKQAKSAPVTKPLKKNHMPGLPNSAPMHQMPMGHMPMGHMPMGHMPMGQMPMGQMPTPDHQPIFAYPTDTNLMANAMGGSNYRNIEPLYPQDTPEIPKDLPSDPLRINMGVEISKDFIEGNHSRLHVDGKERFDNPMVKSSNGPASNAVMPQPRAVQPTKPQSIQPKIIGGPETAAHTVADMAQATQTVKPSSEKNANPQVLQPNTATSAKANALRKDNSKASGESNIHMAQPIETKPFSNEIDLEPFMETIDFESITKPDSRIFNSEKKTNGLALDYESLAFDPQELLIEADKHHASDQNSHSAHSKSGLYILSITALGGVLLAGGLIAMIFLMESKTPMASAIPAALAIFGLIALISAFKDAIVIGLKKNPAINNYGH